VKPPKRRIWESLFCCWRQRSASISSRRSKSSQNGGSVDGLQTQTIGQATGLTGSGQNRYLLPQIKHSDMHKKCMVIDLDETLVHSSFKVSGSSFLCTRKYLKLLICFSLFQTPISSCRLKSMALFIRCMS
jgi:predicted secreted acid phosphatase